MFDDLMRDFAVGGAVLGNLAALYFYAYAGLQLPLGMVIDRWGPRRVLSAAVVANRVFGFELIKLRFELVPPAPSNAITRKVKPLPRREQWARQAHHG